jgi:hypothetical protein
MCIQNVHSIGSLHLRAELSPLFCLARMKEQVKKSAAHESAAL